MIVVYDCMEHVMYVLVNGAGRASYNFSYKYEFTLANHFIPRYKSR